jgi:hypothetical protein
VHAALDANDVLWAIAHLCLPVSDERPSPRTHRMVAVFIDGLRGHASAE